MTLVLALDTSSRTYAVAVGTADRPAAERSSYLSRRNDPAFTGLGELTPQALSDAGAAFADIGAIGVDVGPGGLSSIRAAVAYANGLAFSLGVKIFPVSSLELMALDAAQRGFRDPVLCLKRGQGGTVYAALFAAGERVGIRHGLPESVLPAIAGPLERVTVAGIAATEVAGLLPGVTVEESAIAEADVTVLYQATRRALADPERLVSAATPLNEASPVFHQQTASHG